VLPGADLDQYRLSIREHKPELLTLLVLQDDIVAAATPAQSAFNRAAYDELWRRWYALQEEETTS
jgi:hypothetical protein